ncbi:MAG TPA: lipopolysaccharide biosynthesis protein [Albitalea sp.]|uniref:lipopolysaccharide biosynthesis protein n=1 Tax=Piscinibacter sp. TaxID=1903157 RepID=UPI002ED39342
MRGEMARGAAWMVLFRLFDRSIGVVSTTILARLLVPADFGLVAMAMSVIAIIELATSFSFEVALIQKPDPQREHFDTAWTLNIAFSLGCAGLTAALAYPAASFYGDPRLAPVMLAIAAAWLVTGFENIGVVNFRRNMDFSSEFRFLATKRVIAFAVTIAAAVTFRSYWALVIGTATGRITGVALSYVMQSFRPRFSLACTRELFSFSGWLLANNIAGVVLTRVPHFFVGRVFGAQTLGAYTIGSEIAQLAHTELVQPINRAMFPGYARLVNEPENFRRVCVDATAAILLVVLPVSVGIAVMAAPVVRVLLGAQWSQAVPVIQILAFSGAVSAVTSNNIAAYLALGRPQLITVILLARLLLFASIAMAFARGEGVVNVALAELFAAAGSLLVSLPILFSALKLKTRDYLASLWRPLLASALMGIGLYLMFELLPDQEGLSGAILELVIGVPAGAALYLSFVAALWGMAGRPQSVEMLIARRLYAGLSDRLRRTAS